MDNKLKSKTSFDTEHFDKLCGLIEQYREESEKTLRAIVTMTEVAIHLESEGKNDAFKNIAEMAENSLRLSHDFIQTVNTSVCPTTVVEE